MAWKLQGDYNWKTIEKTLDKEKTEKIYMEKIFNTGETSESLKSEYNPDGSKMRKIQLRMLDMLVYVDKTCKQLGIQYRIDGGTVLGAVRHGGFIPWDDDIDVVLKRHDWKILCEYLKSNPHPQYVLQTHETDPGYYQSWAKIRDLKSEYVQTEDAYCRNKCKGAQLDLFCYDDYGFKTLHSIAKSFEWLNVHFFIRKHPTIANIIYNLSQKILCPLFRVISKPFGRGNYYMHAYGAPWPLQFPTEIILPHKSITFEGFDVQGPADPIGLCKFIYGKNYDKLPPKDKRVTHALDVNIWD